MFRKEVPSYQIAAWILVAMSAPLIQLAGKCSWLTMTAVVFAGAGLSGMALHLDAKLWDNKLYCAVQYGLLIALLTQFLHWSDDCWPTGGDFPVVPLCLLILAVFSGLNGSSNASKVSSVLLWVVGLLFAVILLGGAQNIKVEWLRPSWDAPDSSLILVALLPGCFALIPRQKGKVNTLALAGVVIFTALVSVWTLGNLSVQGAKTSAWPFYKAGKSLSLFGVAERYEAFISAAATLGYFSVYSLVVNAAGSMAEGFCKGWGKIGVIAAGLLAGSMMLFGVLNDPGAFVIPVAALWIILPILIKLPAIFTGKKRKNEDEKKTEKKA